MWKYRDTQRDIHADIDSTHTSKSAKPASPTIEADLVLRLRRVGGLEGLRMSGSGAVSAPQMKAVEMGFLVVEADLELLRLRGVPEPLPWLLLRGRVLEPVPAT